MLGNQTVEAAHQALMNSQGHRENILKADYTNVGIGIVDGGPYGKMFVQMFKG
ncbi:CAP domain-containing protein [Alkalicoccobacillus plakortidis]|uniref:CAP domain-containing protein n=1 Tax=Alkalicoccobacillus plakortidis TaxID=444060 RepID=A0ABT0XIP4_9BACI|nr:CAP domain-containing protein [Alkalicoccobacillus plakortidis]MCM2675074.1 CAP domain-containing protein [Alkalicoccobacillus plakortidis]